MNFATMSVRTRMLYLVAVVIVGLGALTTIFLFEGRAQMMAGKQAKTRNVVEVAYGVIEASHALEKAGLSRAEAQERAKTLLRGMRYDKDEYFWINDMQPATVMHPIKPELEGKDLTNNRDPNGKALFVEFVNTVKASGAGYVDYYWSKPGSDKPVPKISYVKGFEPWGWVVGSGIYVDDVDTEFRKEALWVGSIAVAILAVLLLLARFIGKSILNQLGGEPAYAAEVTRDISAGNLTRQVSNDGSANSLLGALKGTQERLATIFRDIHKAAENLSKAAAGVALEANESSQATHVQADSTASMAASIEQMTVSINEVSALSRQTESTSRQVAVLSETGKQQVGAAEQQMELVTETVRNASVKVQSLLRRSEEIGSIASVIKEIADQTNLLALNAAIEAARAGEQGRGFAVVADEVRKLAERTAGATTEISSVIGAVQTETQNAVDEMEAAIPLVEEGARLSKSASETLETIYRESNESLDRVREVANATQEQASTANDIAQHVESIAQMAEEVSTTMANTAHHAQDMDAISQSLHAQVSYFRV